MWGHSPPQHRDWTPIQKWRPVDCDSSEVDVDGLASGAAGETVAAAVVAAVAAVAAAAESARAGYGAAGDCAGKCGVPFQRRRQLLRRLLRPFNSSLTNSSIKPAIVNENQPIKTLPSSRDS